MSDGNEGGNDGGAGEGAAGESAADILANAGGDSGGEGGAGNDANEGGDGAASPWFDGLASGDEPAEGQLSDSAWLAKKGYKDFNSFVKSARDTEKAVLSGDKLIVPKEGDPPEAFDKYFAAIGRPEAPDQYEIPLPEGHQVDDLLAGAMREAAFKAGVPQAGFKAMTEALHSQLLDRIKEEQAREQVDRTKEMNEYKAELGDKYDVEIQAANQAMRSLELDTDKIEQIEKGLGTRATIELMAKIGKGMGEDVLIGSSGGKNFSLSPSQAQAELDRYNSDLELGKKIASGDSEHVRRREMLMEVVAAAEERKARGG